MEEAAQPYPEPQTEERPIGAQQIQQSQAPESDPIDQDSATNLVGREIEILDDGSAIIKETSVTEVKMGPREFISWMRKHEQTRDDIKDTLSDAVRKATESELEKVEEDIKNLQPYITESEAKAKANYEKLKKEGLISHISDELNKSMSEINLDYMNQVWYNLIENEKDVLDVLSAEQKKKFLKIKVKIMQKKRGRKR